MEIQARIIIPTSCLFFSVPAFVHNGDGGAVIVNPGEDANVLYYTTEF